MLVKDTTSVSFAVPEDPPGPPVLNVVTSTPQMGGGVSGLIQGTKRSGSKLYSVASIGGCWNSLFCLGLMEAGYGSFCVRKGCIVKAHSERKCKIQGKDIMTYVVICREQGDDVDTIFTNRYVD